LVTNISFGELECILKDAYDEDRADEILDTVKFAMTNPDGSTNRNVTKEIRVDSDLFRLMEEVMEQEENGLPSAIKMLHEHPWSRLCLTKMWEWAQYQSPNTMIPLLVMKDPGLIKHCISGYNAIEYQIELGNLNMVKFLVGMFPKEREGCETWLDTAVRGDGGAWGERTELIDYVYHFLGIKTLTAEFVKEIASTFPDHPSVEPDQGINPISPSLAGFMKAYPDVGKVILDEVPIWYAERFQPYDVDVNTPAFVRRNRIRGQLKKNEVAYVDENGQLWKYRRVCFKDLPKDAQLVRLVDMDDLECTEDTYFTYDSLAHTSYEGK